MADQFGDQLIANTLGPVPVTPQADSLDGSAVSDTIHGADLDDTIFGLAGDDTLTGGADNDTLDGGADNDLLGGGIGNDTLIGGTGDDALDGGADTDTADYSGAAGPVVVDLSAGTATGDGTDTLFNIENVIGTSANDSLTGDTGSNVLDGGDGNDVIHGGDGLDTLIGGIGDDRLWGEAGADTLDGGSGEDHAHYENSGAGVQVDLNNAGPQVSTGDASGDVLISIESVHGATNFDNELIGTAGLGEHLKGGDFSDTITGNGGTGGDYIDAQGGDDTLIFNSGDVVLGTTISGGTGSDTLVVQTSTDFSPAGAFITGIEEVEIGAGQTATFGDDQIDGQAWNINGAFGSTETLQVNLVVGTSLDLSGLTFGPDWDDSPSPGDQDSVVVNGSLGDDTVIGSSVADTVFGDDGFDTLSGGFGNDTLDGGADGDTLNGNDGDDVLEGGDGADVLNGGDGFDTASYGGATGPVEINLALGTSTDGDTFISIENITGATSFASTIFGSGGGNVLTGGDFDDELTGAQGDDTVNGGDGDDTALGNMGDDVLNGGLGNDLLKGGNGDDTINGGEGDDTMQGGAGADTYVIEALSGADVIGHFDRFDVVDLSALGSFFDVTDVQAASTDVRGGVLIDLGGGNSLTILGKTIATLDNGDFIF